MRILHFHKDLGPSNGRVNEPVSRRGVLVLKMTPVLFFICLLQKERRIWIVRADIVECDFHHDLNLKRVDMMVTWSYESKESLSTELPESRIQNKHLDI